MMGDAMALAGDGLAVVAAVARGRTTGEEANDNGLDLVAPPLLRAVVDAAACYDLFCHQYDVLPRLFGVGKGDTAAALRLLLHPPPPGESLQQQQPSSEDGNRSQSASAPAETTVSSRSSMSMGAAKERRDARSRKLVASALSQYGLLGRVHMLYAIAPDSVSCPLPHPARLPLSF